MESVLLFHNTSIQSFTHFNQLLQRIKPTIHILQESMIASLGRKIENRTVKPDIIRDTAITDLDDLKDEDLNQDVFTLKLTSC